MQILFTPLDITGMWVFALGVWFHIVARLVYSKPWMAFFLAELIAAILVLFGAYQVLDAWIARVSWKSVRHWKPGNRP